MPLLDKNPNDEVPPDYAANEYLPVRNLLIGVPPSITHEEAAQRLLTAWTEANAANKAVWEQEKDERERQAEEERQQTAQAAEAARNNNGPRHDQQPQPNQDELGRPNLVSEKKKPKLMPMVADRKVATNITNNPCKYATNKLKEFEYVELSYFTIEACSEAAKSDFTVASNAFTLANINDVVSLRPLNQYRASSKPIPDEDLTWRQLTTAKNTLLQAMERTGWPDEYVEALGSFFLRIENHPLLGEEDGETILLKYQARVRRDWHNQLKDTTRDGAFDIGIINEDLVSAIKEEQCDKRQLAGIRESVRFPSYQC